MIELLNKGLTEVEYYIEIQHYQKAKDKLEELLSFSPEDSRLLYLLAVSHRHLYNYREAINYSYESLKNSSAYFEACYNVIGETHLFLNEYEEAEEAFLTVLEVNPENTTTLALYGVLKLGTGNKKKAYSLISEAYRLEPENQNVIISVSYLLLADIKKKENIEKIKDCLHIVDEETRLWLLFTIEKSKKNYQAAKEYYTQYYLLNPSNGFLQYNIRMLDKLSHVSRLPIHLLEKLGPKRFALIFITGFVLWELTAISNYPTLSKIIGIATLSFVGLFFLLLLIPIFYDFYQSIMKQLRKEDNYD